MKNRTLKKFLTEDWVIVFAGAVILALAAVFPQSMPVMPKTLTSVSDLLSAGYMFLFVLVLTYLTSAALKKPLKGIFVSLLLVFVLTLAAQLIAAIPVVKEYGFEPVFFAVILGLLISNTVTLPDWLKSAIQSEFYIKIGIICLGSTILFSEVMKSGVYGLAQSVVVVFTVWYFAFWIGGKMNVDPKMRTMLASAVSICGVSAAIATCGVIRGDNKRLSYIVSLVLIVAVPMMYLLPWIANLIGLGPEVAGAWIGGTIDTTGAVGAAGSMVRDASGADPDAATTAANTAIIVKSSQNVLLGLAAFIISLMWTRQGKNLEERPSARVIWDRFPKFVVGFILASLAFSLIAFFDPDMVKEVKGVTKGFQNTLFSIAFVCIGLETRFKEIFGKENRKPLYTFLIAQTFNIIVTLVVACVIFGLVKPWISSL